MEKVFEKILDILVKLKKPKDILVFISTILLCIFLFTIFENRQLIFDRVSLPKYESANPDVQRKLEIVQILEDLRLKIDADRVYILQINPPYDEDTVEKTNTTVIYEKVKPGLTYIKPAIQKAQSCAYTNMYKMLYKNTRFQANELSYITDPVLKYELEKRSTKSFYAEAIYTTQQKVKYAIVIESFKERAFNNDKSKNILIEYTRLLDYYLSFEN